MDQVARVAKESVPRQDGGRANGLATGLAILERRRVALDRQPAPLLVCKRNALPASVLGVDLLEYANLTQEVLDPPRHPLVDSVRHHRDNELHPPCDNSAGAVPKYDHVSLRGNIDDGLRSIVPTIPQVVVRLAVCNEA